MPDGASRPFGRLPLHHPTYFPQPNFRLSIDCPASDGETLVGAFGSLRTTKCATVRERVFTTRSVTTCCRLPSIQPPVVSTANRMKVSGLNGFGKFLPRPPAPCSRGFCCVCPAAYFGVIAQRASTSKGAAQRWNMVFLQADETGPLRELLNGLNGNRCLPPK